MGVRGRKGSRGQLSRARAGERAQGGTAKARPLSSRVLSFAVYFPCHELLKIHKEEGYNEPVP